MDTTTLHALMINCTLKRSPEASSCDLLGQQILDALASANPAVRVASTSFRAVDHEIAPGVMADMGAGDDWPKLRKLVLDADILVFMTPTWLGQHSSVAQRVLERLDAELRETDEAGRPILYDRVALCGVLGNEDGAHHITGILSQSLGDVGFTIPAQASVYWNGEAMQRVDYNQLEATPEKVVQSTKAAAANAVHLAMRLRGAGYPTP